MQRAAGKFACLPARRICYSAVYAIVRAHCFRLSASPSGSSGDANERIALVFVTEVTVDLSYICSVLKQNSVSKNKGNFLL